MRTYRTKQVDMWDGIAFILYPKTGLEYRTSDLIAANSEHIGTAVFPAGVVLRVPETGKTRTNAGLPPWKR
jgi:phage tail protein X